MDQALRGRLAALRTTGDCCENLDELIHAAARLPLEGVRKRFEALADPSRLLAVALLKRQPGLCGCELQAALKVSHPTVSHHMRVLQEAGLVEGERRGKWVHYRLTGTALALVP